MRLSSSRDAARVATENLRRQIESGILAEGIRLPPERLLAKQLGIARNTLRRALGQLEQEGLLIRQVGVGTFVRAPAAGNGRGLSERLQHASPSELMEVRLIIEPQAAALAASRATRSDIDEIEHALRRNISATSLAEFEHWDGQLHLLIIRATKNTVLMDYSEALNTVRNDPSWYRLKKRSVTPERRQLYERQHTAIVMALKERDSEKARQVMLQHLRVVTENLMNPLLNKTELLTET